MIKFKEKIREGTLFKLQKGFPHTPSQKLISVLGLLVIFLAGCPAPAVKKGGAFRPAARGMGIEGRVVCDGELLENAYVYVYKEVQNGFHTRPFRISAPTTAEGLYVLELPPGNYYVLARKYMSGGQLGPIQVGDYYGYYGGNPVAVTEPGYLWVGLNTVKEAPLPDNITFAQIPLDNAAGLRGVVLYNDQPVAAAYVYLYLDEKTNFKGEAFQSARTDKKGRFYFYTLPESYYYLVARRRQGGGAAGPVQVGDLYAFYGGNPVFAAQDSFATVRIDCIAKAAEIGKESLTFAMTQTRITGKIVDKQGKPLNGLYAFVYLDSDMSHGRPPYLSMQTKANGRFVIYLPGEGTYYLGARALYGDAPRAGELYGRFEGSADHAIKLKAGETTEVTLVVEPILGN